MFCLWLTSSLYYLQNPHIGIQSFSRDVVVMDKSRWVKRIVLFAGMFGIPAFFILFFITGTPTYYQLAYYGDHTVIEKEVNGKKIEDTLFYQANTFSFTDHLGNSITEKDFEAKIILVNILDYNCPREGEGCTMDFLSFKRYIADEVANNEGFKDVMILSAFRTDADTLYRMQEFIQDQKIDTESWKIVTGDMAQFYNVDMETQNPWTEKDTIFGKGTENVAQTMTLLIDKDKHIRGKYITLYTSEVKRITKEISILLREEKNQSQ